MNAFQYCTVMLPIPRRLAYIDVLLLPDLASDASVAVDAQGKEQPRQAVNKAALRYTLGQLAVRVAGSEERDYTCIWSEN